MMSGQEKMQLVSGCQHRSWHLEMAWAAALAATGGGCTSLVCLSAGRSLLLNSPLNAATAIFQREKITCWLGRAPAACTPQSPSRSPRR